MDAYQRTIISQYATDPVTAALIGSMNAWLDPAASIDAFYSQVWDILQTVGYGLDVWGRILGLSRTVQVPIPERFFGFAEQGNTALVGTFNEVAFVNPDVATQNFVMADPLYRSCLIAKAATNVWDGSILGINAILMALFPHRGRAYATDGRDMTMTYTFEFNLSAIEAAIITSGVIPRPTGVAASIVIL